MVELQQLPWKDIITIGLASVGSVLGVMNTWNAMNQQRVKLRVTPKNVISFQGGEAFCIEVVNLSSFPVTISEIGFSLDGKRVQKGIRAVVSAPIFLDEGVWPQRLEPRSSVSGYFDKKEVYRDASSIGKAYASTECGVTRYGTSPALEKIINNV